MLSNHVKHKPCQTGIVAGDVTMYNLNFVLEMRCVNNWNSIKTWTRKLHLSTIVLNISVLLVKRTTNYIAKIGIWYCDFRFQERKQCLFLLCTLQFAIPFLICTASSWQDSTLNGWLKVHIFSGWTYDIKAGILNIHC